MNKLYIIGNMSTDVELRSTTSGKSVCNFNVAVNRRYKQDGQPEADFFHISVWGEMADICAKYLSKGKKVAVVGTVSVRTWQSNEKHGASLEVTAEQVEFLSPRSEGQQAQPEPQVDQQTGLQQVDTDELPF